MTTLGFHYFPDDTHYRRADLAAWLPELAALDAKWLTLVGSLTRAVPEAFIKDLLDAGIQPVIHVPGVSTRRDAQASALSSLDLLFKTYAQWGVKYVVPFAEPNSRSAWAPADWGQAGLVERFLDRLVPVLQAQAEAGLQPTFPPLRPGGDYWDTAFLEAALAGLARRGQDGLLKGLTFAVYLWTYNRPFAWGQGGLQRWPETRPYLTPPNSQDQRGFHLFDWYDEIIRDRVGESRPLLCLAGGPRIGDQTDPQFPAVTDLWHASCIEEIARAANDGRLPAHLLNVNFWLLAAPEGTPFVREAWYRPDGTTVAAVDALKRLAASGQRAERRRLNESRGMARQVPHGPASKALQHYVLLPVFEWGVSEWHWTAALEYVKQHRPACGFSPDEAARAARVTIFGNEQGVSVEVEASLRQAGCQVDRILVSPA